MKITSQITQVTIFEKKKKCSQCSAHLVLLNALKIRNRSIIFLIQVAIQILYTEARLHKSPFWIKMDKFAHLVLLSALWLRFSLFSCNFHLFYLNFILDWFSAIVKVHIFDKKICFIMIFTCFNIISYWNDLVSSSMCKYCTENDVFVILTFLSYFHTKMI